MYAYLDDRQVSTTYNWSNQLERSIRELKIEVFEHEKFNKIKFLGNGAFGTVYQANDKYKNVVAMKSLNINSEAVMKAFINEFKLHREVHFHNNILQFLGFCRNGDECFLILEYADGGTLRKYLQENMLDWNKKFELSRQMTSAVMFLHDRNIIHRDLHSMNILVHQGKIKISDFGLSRKLSELSDNSKTYGVLPYIDPQNLLCGPKQSYRSKKCDIYSLGVLLWEISSGSPPFEKEKNEKSYLLLANEIVSGRRESKVAGTPDEYLKLYSMCWDGDPNKRPDISQVYESLNDMKKSVTSDTLDLINRVWNLPESSNLTTTKTSIDKHVTNNDQYPLDNNSNNHSPLMKKSDVSRTIVASNEVDFMGDTIEISDDFFDSQLKFGDVAGKYVDCIDIDISFLFDLKFTRTLHFFDRNTDRILPSSCKTSAWLNLYAYNCKDVSSFTDVYLDNKFLNFTMSRFVICKLLKGKVMPPTKIKDIAIDIFKLFVAETISDTSLADIDPVKDLKLIILDEEDSNYKFEVPVGLAFRFQGFIGNKVLLGLCDNDISKKFFKKVQEDVVSRTVAKIVDVYLEDESFLDAPYIHFANNFYNGSRETVKNMVLDLLVREQVNELEINTLDFITSFFLTEGLIYLQEEENFNEFSIFDILSQYPPEVRENLIVKNVLDDEQNRSWVMELA
ncbi:15330_t:CDS:2 [Acaulospora morrowiae]|uniref:15330_t:CDS:1 n=1 Tax=Acaulospora morrowiae TaxID=94023 RepID=A0A9N8WLR2_9GLOM|nr:15330_t:CDS:2 [Acaulospora morrowiae]